MVKISYDTYDESGDSVPRYIKDLILRKDPNFDLDYGKFKLRQVKSPFILADNQFDLREANNTIIF